MKKIEVEAYTLEEAFKSVLYSEFDDNAEYVETFLRQIPYDDARAVKLDYIEDKFKYFTKDEDVEYFLSVEEEIPPCF